MSAESIYLDYNATTPVDSAVFDAMLPYLRGEFGNPSSAHGLGNRAHHAVETARAEVARLIGAAPDEIVFTSGGTEASNIAIRGAVRIDPSRRAVVTSTIEHPATEACCARNRPRHGAGHANPCPKRDRHHPANCGSRRGGATPRRAPSCRRRAIG